MKKKALIVTGAVLALALVIFLVTRPDGTLPVAVLPEPESSEVVVESASSGTEIHINPNTSQPSVPAESSESSTPASPDTGTESSSSTTDAPVQNIQPEPSKPAAPSEPVRTDPTQTPDGTPVTTPPTPTPHSDPTPPVSTGEPQPGDQKDGKIYVPGFGWVTDEGGGTVQRDSDSDGDINTQVGNM